MKDIQYYHKVERAVEELMFLLTREVSPADMPAVIAYIKAEIDKTVK